MQSKRTDNLLKLIFYAALWLLFAYLYVQILLVNPINNENLILSGMYFVEFGVHEVSHIVFSFLPSIFVAAAGSFGEVTFTWLLVYAAFKAKSYFAGIFSLLWVALAMSSVGTYMADARTQQLPLMSMGSDPQHDWHFVFGQLGWMDWDTLIGGAVRTIGAVCGLVGLAIGLYLLAKMVSAPPLGDKTPVKKPT